MNTVGPSLTNQQTNAFPSSTNGSGGGAQDKNKQD
jgi:hypothetical protein